jgi:hypothetical protein
VSKEDRPIRAMIEDFLESVGADSSDDNVMESYEFLREVLLYLFRKRKGDEE